MRITLQYQKLRTIDSMISNAKAKPAEFNPRNCSNVEWFSATPKAVDAVAMQVA